MRRLSLIALLALVAAACGGDDAAPTTEPLSDLSGQSIEVAAVWTGSEQDNFRQVLDAFQASTGATVSYVSTGDDIATVLGTRIQGGSPPDIAMLPQPGLMADLVGRNALRPVEDIAGALVDANYAPVWRELGSVDGTLYGVWFKAANKSTVWYRVDAFEDAGVEPPETWEDLQAVAQQLSDAGHTPFSVGGADGWVLTDWFENIYLRTAGPELYDDLTVHAIPFTDDSVVEALEVMAEIFGESEWLAGGSSGVLQTDFPTSVSDVFGASPRAAMVYEGDFVAGVIDDETPSELVTDARFFPFPSIAGSPPAVVGGGDVAVLLTDNEAAAELMRFLASAEAGEIWAALGGFTSPNRNVDVGVYPDEISRQSAEALGEASVFRFDMSDLHPAAFGGTPGQGSWALLQDFVRNPANAQAIASQLESAAAQAFN